MKEETILQNEYINKCKEEREKLEKKLSRPVTFHVTTFGCQMNARDSEKLSGILEAAGYVKKEEEDADVVILNTCTVRENANQKVYGRLGYLKTKKEKNPEMKIMLCGCMMQEPSVIEKIKESYRFVDLVFGTFNLYRFAELLYKSQTHKGLLIEIEKEDQTIVEDLPTDRKYKFKSGVNIMFGCNNFCSYCIVPYVRGREKSRTSEDIIDEVKKLAEDGVMEVMLLGQNVNSYGKGLDEDISFAELLRKVCDVSGIERVRFMTSHPKDLSDELIDVMAENEKICRHLHLPLQSGSDEILKRMNRHYTKEDYLKLVEKIRAKVPGIAITTDIIVGFPGETEEDFLETMDVCEKVRFDSAFTFIYSKRTGTPAASYEDQVPEDVIKDRFDRLLALVQRCGRERAEEWTNETLPVLFEDINRQDENLVTGRLSNNSVVHVKGDESLIGKILPVRLTECRGFYYMGEIA